jgi:hypothetical protein
MPIFEQVRDRLPSLYRPSDDAADGEQVPLRAADVLGINGAAPPPGSLRDVSGSVRVTLPAPAPIRELRLSRAAATGSLVNLELYRMSGDSPLNVAGAVARLEGDRARPNVPFTEDSFTLRLRRPGLLTLLLWATSRILERTQSEATRVMQSHWFEYADAGRFDAFFLRTRELQGLLPPTADDATLVQFPYIHDLARIGALLALLPWREPAAHREKVEDYRQRIGRIVALYRNGLGTVDAIRGMVEAQLPVDLSALPGLRDRPFTVEEFSPLAPAAGAVQARGTPVDMVGPLMRWGLTSTGISATTPTVIVQGVTPEAGRIDATTRPVLELFTSGGARRRLGIGYEGDLAPGQALRLRPAFASWVLREDGLLRAEALPAAASGADPTAPGPWTTAPGAPTAAARLLVQSADRALWLATGSEAGGALHRFDGAAWTEALTGLPEIRALARDGDTLLVGTSSGLFRLPLHPPEGETLTPSPEPAALTGTGVNALVHAADGTWYAATETGLARVGAADALDPFVLGADAESEVTVHAVHEDGTGTLHVGTALGAFRFQPGLGHWYWYRGEQRSDQFPDWERLTPEAAGEARNFPTPEDVFLPPVRCIHRGPDASLWLGTDRGIARYVARPVRGLTYTTLLEAFPDLCDAPVHAIREDDRGLVWFATERGLFRFDGRDWWQMQEGLLTRLSAPAEREARQARFNRALDRWELFTVASGAWAAFAAAPRGEDEPPVLDILWTDGAAAELGSWDGTTFTADAELVPAALRMRYKPEEIRIVEGGIPAVPRMDPGASEWRYLSLEPAELPAPRSTPAWSIEGRLIPPPPDRAPVLEGRHSGAAPLDLSRFDDAAFAFNPAARVWFYWEPRHPLSILVRLGTVSAGERIDPAILDRVWQGIQQVRPAGVRALLAAGEETVRRPA